MIEGRDAPRWFVAPGPEFRTATFWFWHRIPTDAEIREQLADMKAKGIGTVMIQARGGLPLEQYLSPAYLAAYALAAAEMKRLGLQMTIYDEYCWMSGHGGGRTVDGADHLRERHLFWSVAPVDGSTTELTVSNIRSPFHDFLGEAGKSWIYEQGGAHWGDWDVAAALVLPDGGSGAPEALRIVPPALARVEATGPRSCRVRLETADRGEAGGTAVVFVSARCQTSRMINYLLAEAAERFAAKVYKPLVEASGNAASGVFFDHPYAGFYVWDEHTGDLGNSLLWDEALAARTEPSGLVALIRDVGPTTARLRADFFRAYQARLHEAFFGTLARWTAQHGLAFTGHELLTHVGAWGLHAGLGGFDPRTMPGVDYFGIDAYRTMTSVDAADYQPQLAARMGDSVARANGRRRCTVEQYSTGRETGTPALAGQWGLTAERFRAQAIRHLVAGARQILLHAVNVTDEDAGDARQFGNPRFDFPPGFNFEPWWDDCPALFTELARLSAFLEDGAPVRTVALFYPLQTIRAGAMAPDCGEHFGWWAQALDDQGLGYDVIDERQIESALAHGSAYRMLVLPAVTVFVSPRTVDAIAAFVDGGGRLLVSGSTPTALGASPLDLRDERVALWLPGAEPDAVSDAVRHLPRPRPDICFDAGPTVSSVARCEEGWRLVVFNDQSVARTVSMTFDAPAVDVMLWDAETGDVRPVESSGSRNLRLELGAHRLLCLSTGAALPQAARARESLAATGSAGLSETGARVVLHDGWTLQIGSRSAVPVSVDRGWEVQGWPTYAGTGTYRRRVLLSRPAEGRAWTLVLPGLCHSADILVNGDLLGRHVAGEARFPLAAASGEVEIEIRVRNTAANRYYAGTPFWQGPQPSGLTRPPVLVACRGDAV